MNCFGIFDNNNVETIRTSKNGKQVEVARRASSHSAVLHAWFYHAYITGYSKG